MIHTGNILQKRCTLDCVSRFYKLEDLENRTISIKVLQGGFVPGLHCFLNY
jgi:hypothetical protein